MIKTENIENKKLDFYTVFYNTLKNIPVSLENQFVYYWSLKRKKFICEEEPKLLLLGLINKEDLEMAMEKIHNIEHIDPEERFSKKTSWFISCILYISILFSLYSGFMVIVTNGDDADLDFMAFTSLIFLGISFLLYSYCYITPKEHELKMEKRCKDLLDTLNELNTFFLRKNTFWKYGPCGAFLTYHTQFCKKVINNGENIGVKLIPKEEPCLDKETVDKNIDLIDTVFGVIKGATGETQKITGNIVKMILTPIDVSEEEDNVLNKEEDEKRNTLNVPEKIKKFISSKRWGVIKSKLGLVSLKSNKSGENNKDGRRNGIFIKSIDNEIENKEKVNSKICSLDKLNSSELDSGNRTSLKKLNENDNNNNNLKNILEESEMESSSNNSVLSENDKL